jgi:peroxiredoxin
MRKILALIPILAFASVVLAQAPSAAKATQAPHFTPRPAGEFVIHMTDGSQKLLSSYRGKVVVMAFMYTTCTHCQHTAGILAKINTQYAGKGVQILGDTIDSGAAQGIATFLKITGANFPVGYSTSEQALRFLHGPQDGWFVPMLAFIDRNGLVRSQYIVTDTDDSANKFLEDQEVTIPKEIDRLLKMPATATKQAPKS